jgi:cyclic pyranopterin phosphate synthase
MPDSLFMWKAGGLAAQKRYIRRMPTVQPLIDPFGRAITYLRMSVTDRCDLRCAYCMAEDMVFLPRKELLTLEELDRLCSAFVRKGVRKIRLTGGEPLVRRGIMDLINGLSRHLASGDLSELTLTTNATQLSKYADDLAKAGVKRINVSLDTLDPDAFRRITRGGDVTKVMDGIDAALAAGLKVKINAVALKDDNLADLPGLIEWAHGKGMSATLIEIMPMGETGENRVDQFASLLAFRDEIAQRWTLTDIPERTGGPARYVRIEETGGKLGFITPLTGNFCEGCNRVRVTCTGQMYMCLGQEDMADLRTPLRSSEGDFALEAAIDEAITRKPKGHDFVIERARPAATPRHMSVTGG